MSAEKEIERITGLVAALAELTLQIAEIVQTAKEISKEQKERLLADIEKSQTIPRVLK